LPTRIKNTKIFEPNSVYFQIAKEIKKSFTNKFEVFNVFCFCNLFLFFENLLFAESVVRSLWAAGTCSSGGGSVDLGTAHVAADAVVADQFLKK